MVFLLHTKMRYYVHVGMLCVSVPTYISLSSLSFSYVSLCAASVSHCKQPNLTTMEVCCSGQQLLRL